MADPTSWYAIETGWTVQGRDGTAIGTITAVVGDEDVDIFDGLRLETSDGEELFAPADRVADIVEGQIFLDADLAELEAPAEAAPGGVELSRDRDAEL
jgi:hypothetical protein